MDYICSPNDMWLPLMTASLTGAGLTLTGGKFFIDILIKDVRYAFSEAAIFRDNIMDILNKSRYWYSTFFLLIVITFLIADISVIFYLVGNRSEGIYLSYMAFFGAIVSIIYILHMFLSFIRQIRSYNAPEKMKQQKNNPSVDSRIHKVGIPGKISPIFITSNSASDYHRLEPDLGSEKINSYIIPINTGGFRLSGAIESNLITAKLIKETLDSFSSNDLIFKDRMNHYPSVILPRLAHNLKSELEDLYSGNLKVFLCPNPDDEIGIWYKENFQEDPRIYKIGNVNSKSPIFICSNDESEFSRYKQILIQYNLDSYIIIMDTKYTPFLSYLLTTGGNTLSLKIRNLVNDLILDDEEFALMMRKNAYLVLPYGSNEIESKLIELFNGHIKIYMGPRDMNSLLEWLIENGISR